MSKRLAVLAATSALALSLPVAAQVDDRYAGVGEVIETYSEPVVQEASDWSDGPDSAGASYAHGDYAEPDYVEEVVQRHRHHGGHHPQVAAPAGPPQLAYTAAERDEWLAQCRALHAPQQDYYYEEERDRNGGIIGGVIGAVAGGVIGHEVRNRNRWVGTVLGAGIGGVAGAVLGSVIDEATDGDGDDRRRMVRDEDPGFDYCAAYLQNYERGYGAQGQMAYAQVMLVPVQQATMQPQRRTRQVIIEEEVEVEAPRHHTAGRAMHRQSDGDKRLRAD